MENLNFNDGLIEICQALASMNTNRIDQTLKKYNISLKDTNGNYKDLYNLLEELNEKFIIN